MLGFRQHLFIPPVFSHNSHRFYREIMRVFFGKSVSRIQDKIKAGIGDTATVTIRTPGADASASVLKYKLEANKETVFGKKTYLFESIEQ